MRTSDDSSALARLLQDAAGPALPDELAGEQAARTMFSEARPTVTAEKEKRVFSKILITKALGVKLGAAAIGLSFVGAATAAETGALPGGLQNGAHSVLGGIGVPTKDEAKATAAVGADLDKDKDKKGDKDAPTPTGTAAPKPKPSPSGSATAKDDDDKTLKDQARRDGDGAAFLGKDAFWLCKAAANGDKDDKGADLGADQLQRLAKAAGIPADQITAMKSKLDAQRLQFQKMMDGFCARLASAQKDLKDGKKPPFPIPTDWPKTWPTDWPTNFPTDIPSGVPTKLPSGWPSKPPTDVPSGTVSIPVPTKLPSGFPTRIPPVSPMPTAPGHSG